jgi:hypothetical protein
VRKPIYGLVAVAVATFDLTCGGSAHAYGPGKEIFRFADRRITESSGIVSSSSQERILFTHNDSGDTARFFAVDFRGCTQATYPLVGADANDWEDMARGPDERGRSALYFADIGDNLHQRTAGISVYRVAEPKVDVRTTGAKCRAGITKPVRNWVRFDLAYPDLPQDAETLLVHPRSGQIFVVTKTYLDVSGVYAAPDPLRPGVPNMLERVATIVFPPSTVDPTPNPPFGAIGRVNATGGDIAPKADRVVVRTYTDAWEWKVDGDVVAAFAATPTQIPLPFTQQGEAITYSRNGRSLVTSTEGVNAPVHLLP